MGKKEIQKAVADVKKDIRKAAASIESCKLVINNDKFVLECPPSAIIPATKTIQTDGILVREIRVESKVKPGKVD